MPPKQEKTFVTSLISAVKTHGEIWDFTHLHYNNNQVLLDTWDQLGKRFNLSGNDVRVKWKALRDTYKKCESRHRETGQPVTWPYYKSLKFLNVTYPGKKSKKITIKEEPFDQAEIEIESAQSLNCTDGLITCKVEEPFQCRESDKDDTILEYPFDESIPEYSPQSPYYNQDDTPQNFDTPNYEEPINPTGDFPVVIKTEPMDDINDIVETVIPEEMMETPIVLNERNTTVREIKPNEDELKAFLLALLPEVEPMDRKQMRLFKKEVSNLVKTILDK